MSERGDRADGTSSIRPLLLAIAALSALVAGLIAAVALWPVRATARQQRAPELCTRARPCLAIVIDDVGRDLQALERLQRIPLALTYSVLPHARYTAESLALLRAAGAEHWLHLPMEPIDAGKITDEPIVLSASRPILPGLRECLARVPGATGVSNHMGSALSEQPRALVPLLADLRARGLPFLDSRTSPRSKICEVAKQVALPCVQRDVFLDDLSDEVGVKYRIEAVVNRSIQRGWGVAVGHPLERTIEALERFAAEGHTVNVVRLSRLFLTTSVTP